LFFYFPLPHSDFPLLLSVFICVNPCPKIE